MRLETAEAWVVRWRLSGALTRYPIDASVYEWAVRRGFFEPSEPAHRAPTFLGGFSSSRQERRYYDRGQLSAC